MFKNENLPTPEDISLLAKAGSADYQIHIAHARELAKAIEKPLREGQLPGDIIGGIFNAFPVTSPTSQEFPMDIIAPGTEKDYVAYTMPNQGYIPDRDTNGDYVMVPTYDVAAGIGTSLKYIRDANWFVMGRLREVMKAQFIKKMNDDAFHTLMAAGNDRNVVVYDPNAANGQFTKRVVSIAQLVMKRNGGGNTGSSDVRRLTDLYTSLEAQMDMRNWGVDMLDQTTLREIYTASEDGTVLNRIYGVNLHPLNELGDNEEYQLYFENTLSGTMASGDVEIGIGLDLSGDAGSTFVMPVRENVQVFEDPTAHRRGRFELYGRASLGFGVLDSRRVLLISM